MDFPLPYLKGPFVFQMQKGQATLAALHASGVSAVHMEAPVVLASIG